MNIIRKPIWGYYWKQSISIMLSITRVILSINLLLLFQFSQAQTLSQAAVELTKVNVTYDPAYVVIDYPNGDVPAHTGVCTDVVIRAYRKLGIDLQKEVHEDMKRNFSKYPQIWGLRGPDKNIDHRRVPNLMKYFSRFGETKKISDNPYDYKAGDIVCWDLGGGTTHIGILINQKARDGITPMVVHNIGGGQEISDCLFSYTIIGHYRYKGR